MDELQVTEDLANERTPVLRARVGDTIAGFTLERLLGIGGHSAVYAATGRDGERVALKVMHAGLAGHGELRERLAREARAANALKDVGGVRVLAYGVDPGGAFLAMELLEGETLTARVRRCPGGLRTEEVCRIGVALLGVVGEAHARGFVHRDVKPENVFLSRDGQVRMLDFGLAREEGAALAGGGLAAVGTPAFMAPEQARGGAGATVGGDVWGVGATLFTALTGRYVHLASTPGEMLFIAAREPAPPVGSVRPDVAPALGRVIDRALRFRPEDRWRSAAEMREALAGAAGVLPVSARDAVAETLPEETMVAPFPSLRPARAPLHLRSSLGAVAALLLVLGMVLQRGPVAAGDAVAPVRRARAELHPARGTPLRSGGASPDLKSVALDEASQGVATGEPESARGLFDRPVVRVETGLDPRR